MLGTGEAGTTKNARYMKMAMRRILKTSAVVLAAAVAVAICPRSAQAVVVTVEGAQYEVGYFEGAYNGNAAKFALPSAGGIMPWWGNKTLAEAFSAAIETALGVPNFTTYGPIFAYEVAAAPNISGGVATFGAIYNSTNPVGFRIQTNQASLTFNAAYASAQLLAPVPGPLPLFGAAAAFGMSRRLRRRLQPSR